MKKLGIIASLILSSVAFGGDFTGKDLPVATTAALAEYSVEFGEDSLHAWKSSIDGHEILVETLGNNGAKTSFGCHLHGADMVCHEEAHAQGNEHNHNDHKNTDVNFLENGHKAALAKFTKTLTRKGADLSVVSEIKVWKTEDAHGHGVEADVWTKFDFTLDSKKQNIFVICHVHGSESHFSCHYNRSGSGEPAL